MTSPKCRLLSVIIDLDGGAGIFCRNLNSGLKQYFPDDFELSLLMFRNRGLLEADREVFDTVRIAHSRVDRNWRRIGQTLAHAVLLRKQIRDLHPDVILAVGIYPNVLTSLVAGGARCILTVHSNTTLQLNDSPYRPLLKRILRWRYARSMVVAPSQGVADDLRRNFNAREVRVIHHGIDLQLIRALADEKPADLPPRTYIVACGRLTAAKDYPTLLRAFELARRQGLSHDLLIIGGGELLEELKRLAISLNLQNSVHFFGHRDNPYPYIRGGCFFVLSSVWEGFGLALVEAMSLGLPCIATDCPSGPGEILSHGDHGVLIRPGDVAELSQAMLDLAASEEKRRTLSAASLERSRDFALENMAGQYRQLFLKDATSD